MPKVKASCWAEISWEPFVRLAEEACGARADIGVSSFPTLGIYGLGPVSPQLATLL
jgi:hypothetical protein